MVFKIFFRTVQSQFIYFEFFEGKEEKKTKTKEKQRQMYALPERNVVYCELKEKKNVVVPLRFFCLNINYNPFLASFKGLLNTGVVGGNVIIVQ